jgi:hypothetical protein
MLLACLILSTVFFEIGKIDSAKILSKQSLEINKKVFGTDSQEYASSLNDIGDFFNNW